MTGTIPGRARAVGAVPADGAVDETGVGRPQVGRPDAQPGGHPGAEVLDQHVGGHDDVAERLHTGGRFEVEDHAAPVPVQGHPER